MPFLHGLLFSIHGEFNLGPGNLHKQVFRQYITVQNTNRFLHSNSNNNDPYRQPRRIPFSFHVLDYITHFYNLHLSLCTNSTQHVFIITIFTVQNMSSQSPDESPKIRNSNRQWILLWFFGAINLISPLTSSLQASLIICGSK